MRSAKPSLEIDFGGRMVDVFDKAKRSTIMASIRARDTEPEMIVRRIAFGLGYRYRLYRKDLPGRPDLTFSRLHKVIFVHGCFWHHHDCRAGRTPSSNLDYWIPKLNGNVARDKRHLKELRKLGWKCLVIWQCQLKETGKVISRISKFLSSP